MANRYFIKKGKFNNPDFKNKTAWHNEIKDNDCNIIRVIKQIFNFIIDKYDVIHIVREKKQND